MNETTTPEAPSPAAGDGPTAAGPEPDTGPRVTGEQMRDLTLLRRTTIDKKVAGVAGGLARHLDIDPLIVRIAFVVLTFFGGAGPLLYAAGWLLLPSDDGPAKLDLDARTRTMALYGAGVLALLITVGSAFGSDNWGGWSPWVIVPIAFFVYLLAWRRNRNEAAARTTGTVDFTKAPARPVRVRRRPSLFWIAVPSIAFALGLLALINVAGVHVIASAYPALALTVIAGLLILGAFWGRANGLIALGVIAAIAMFNVGAKWDGGGERTERPTSAAGVASEYRSSVGELTLDLTAVTDPAALAGKRVELRTSLGRIEVVVPRDMAVDVDARTGGPGSITLFGQPSQEGLHVKRTGVQAGPSASTPLHLDVSVSVGEIVVRNP